MIDPLGEDIIKGSDVVMTLKQDLGPIPTIQDPDNPWLPKTDWSRDGIIASDD